MQTLYFVLNKFKKIIQLRKDPKWHFWRDGAHFWKTLIQYVMVGHTKGLNVPTRFWQNQLSIIIHLCEGQNVKILGL